jgi:hypothetical protein
VARPLLGSPHSKSHPHHHHQICRHWTIGERSAVYVHTWSATMLKLLMNLNRVYFSKIGSFSNV